MTVAMTVADWLELSTLKALSKHTTSIVAAALSFGLIDRVVKWVIGPGTLFTVIGHVDQFVLFVLFLWFASQMFFVLWKARVRNLSGNELISLVA